LPFSQIDRQKAGRQMILKTGEKNRTSKKLQQWTYEDKIIRFLLEEVEGLKKVTYDRTMHGVDVSFSMTIDKADAVYLLGDDGVTIERIN
jgi:hypothetical protein